MSLGPLLFEVPFALMALGLLPIIWWLLRFTPPKPDRVAFPPIRLLLGLMNTDETRHKSPWWLTLLRTVLAALVILALAEPVFNPDRDVSRKSGRLLVAIDDSWMAAPTWHLRSSALETIINSAEQTGRPVALAMTTPRSTVQTIAYKTPSDVRQLINSLEPRPFKPDRPALIAEIKRQLGSTPPEEVVWLSDGMDYGSAAEFGDSLKSLSDEGTDLRILTHEITKDPSFIAASAQGDGSLIATVRRTDTNASPKGTVRALALNGRTLGDAAFEFKSGETEAEVSFEIPLALRNQIGRFEIVGGRTAGAVFLLDDRWRRRPVGLVSGTSNDLSQPLLSPLHYATHALAPFAQITEATVSSETSGIKGLLDQGQSVLIVADIGQFLDDDTELLEKWVDRGGVLVRFAGPRLASNSDDLIPVKLRRGGRALGGALSWSKPQSFGPFDDKSPFAGLETLSKEVTVRRQVLAEPSADLAGKVWARLEDGTPLVTAEPRGNGLVVLFHVPASPVWSNLPLSGVFVEMLKRIVDLSNAPGAKTTSERADINAPQALPPVRVLNGFGELVKPPVDTIPLSQSDRDKQTATPQHPPGIYGRGQVISVVNTVEPDQKIERLGSQLSGVEVASFKPVPSTPLKGPLLALAMALLILDALAVLAISGRILGSRFSRSASTTAALGLVAMLILPALLHGPARAQVSQEAPPISAEERFALEATLKTRLAYVESGNANVDAASQAGLHGLSEALSKRTALEPGSPVGVDLERDDITFFPMLYWPMIHDAPLPPKTTLAKIDAYMKNGGTIFFDTRDQHRSLTNSGSLEASPGTRTLRRILTGLDIPPLEIIPADHVLTKAFYLLQSFPGRWAGGQLWVEAITTDGNARRGASNFDGVSSIIIGSNDYAAAWAMDTRGEAMFPVVPGGPRQRELAYRTGINVVIYALTGNYKADQVHVPALLERLGQ